MELVCYSFRDLEGKRKPPIIFRNKFFDLVTTPPNGSMSMVIASIKIPLGKIQSFTFFASNIHGRKKEVYLFLRETTLVGSEDENQID